MVVSRCTYMYYVQSEAYEYCKAPPLSRNGICKSNVTIQIALMLGCKLAKKFLTGKSSVAQHQHHVLLDLLRPHPFLLKPIHTSDNSKNFNVETCLALVVSKQTTKYCIRTHIHAAKCTNSGMQNICSDMRRASKRS